MPVSFSTSTDPTVNAQAAFRFLSRRAVDGYVESQKAVVSALEDSRTRREEGRALLLLQGFCYHNSRKGYSVEERLDRLEKVSIDATEEARDASTLTLSLSFRFALGIARKTSQ